jgi:hypothetical protein
MTELSITRAIARKLSWLALPLVASVLSGLALPVRADSPPPIVGPVALQPAGERARSALVPLKQNLKSALVAALADSPTAAVDVCQLSAPVITEGARRPGIRVGRTSDRLRNPANAPRPWMEPLLAQLAEQKPPPGAGRVVALEGDRVGYVEPIYLMPLCATCHGESVEPKLLAHIRERYPEDRAVAYKPGDLRGMFWVVVEGAAARDPLVVDPKK